MNVMNKRGVNCEFEKKKRDRQINQPNKLNVIVFFNIHPYSHLIGLDVDHF